MQLECGCWVVGGAIYPRSCCWTTLTTSLGSILLTGVWSSTGSPINELDSAFPNQQLQVLYRLANFESFCPVFSFSHTDFKGLLGNHCVWTCACSLQLVCFKVCGRMIWWH